MQVERTDYDLADRIFSRRMPECAARSNLAGAGDRLWALQIQNSSTDRNAARHLICHAGTCLSDKEMDNYFVFPSKWQKCTEVNKPKMDIYFTPQFLPKV